MQVIHPRALDGDPPQIAVDVAGEHVTLDADGTFEVPDDASGWLRDFAQSYGHEPDELVREEDGPPDSNTCAVIKSDGERCGRELPCRYHSDDDTSDDTSED